MTATVTDLSEYAPAPTPEPEAVEKAADILVRMAEVDALQEGLVSFRLDTLECTGWWPTEDDWQGPNVEFTANVPFAGAVDVNDLDGWFDRIRERARLEVRQGFERANLERRLMHDALAEGRAA